MCAAVFKATTDSRRGSASERGYDARWQRARKRYLAEHPLCAEHKRHGQFVPATVVDHVQPHKGNQALFWSPANWQPLCKPCHDRKTATEDGGFATTPGGRPDLPAGAPSTVPTVPRATSSKLGFSA